MKSISASLTKQQSDILYSLYQEPFINQRVLAEMCGHSLGAVNRSVKELIKNGFLDEKCQIGRAHV